MARLMEFCLSPQISDVSGPWDRLRAAELREQTRTTLVNDLAASSRWRARSRDAEVRSLAAQCLPQNGPPDRPNGHSRESNKDRPQRRRHPPSYLQDYETES